MAFSAHGILEKSRFVDVDLDSSVEILVSGAVTLYGFEVDNTQNSSAVFVKIWDATSVTIGTDDPDVVVKVDAADKVMVPLNANAGGLALTTGLAVACVTTGGTAGSTSPTSDVTGTFHTD